MKPFPLPRMPRIAWVGLLLLVGVPTMLSAQVPNRIHYQGYLTADDGTPVTGSRTIYFSIIIGGTAEDASSGTEAYQESATVVLSELGVFEHQIGTGTVQIGSFEASMFDTSDPVFLQVAVGSPDNVLLPRARVTSVGYAFVAEDVVGDISPTSITIEGVGEVIDAGGNWVGSTDGLMGPSGNPTVNAVTDVTGGLTVIGDRLRIEGEDLADAVVTIGGMEAPIKSVSESELICQVPAGLASGLQPVAVAPAATGGASLTVAHVNVHRLLVWVSPGSGTQIFVIDSQNGQIIGSVNPGFTISSGVIPLQIAFANEGSVVIVPQGGSGLIRAIDLTANPPQPIGSSYYNTGATQATAVAVSPDSLTAIVSDSAGNRLRTFPIEESFPPYSDSFYGSVFNVTVPSGFSTPIGSGFLGDSVFVVCGQGSDELIAYQRPPGVTQFTFTSLSDPDRLNRVTTPNSPFGLRVAHDGTHLLINANAQNGLATRLTAPEGFSSSSAAALSGNQAYVTAIAPNDKTLYVADLNTDRIITYHLDGTTLTRLGVFEGPADGRSFEIAAVEPVAGDTVVVGTNGGTVEYYRATGPALAFLGNISLGQSRGTFALEFQP